MVKSVQIAKSSLQLSDTVGRRLVECARKPAEAGQFSPTVDGIVDNSIHSTDHESCFIITHGEFKITDNAGRTRFGCVQLTEAFITSFDSQCSA